MAECCEWTGTALLRQAAFAPQGLRTFENITALKEFRVSTPQNGMLAWVLSVQDAFEYQADSALTDDGITIATPVSTVGRWIRLGFPNERWARQTSWHIDANIGNDENSGTTQDSAGALKSHAEFARRVRGLTLGESIVVVIHTDLPETLELDVKFREARNSSIPAASLTYVGIPVETFWTHTVTSAVGPNSTTNTAPSLTDSSVTDWTAVFPKNGGRFRIVGGARDGAIGWAVKQNATTLTEMRTSSFGTSTGFGFTEVVPAGGDTYTAERIPRVGGVNFSVTGLSGVVTIESIAVSPGNPTFRNQLGGSVAYLLRYCDVSGVALFGDNLRLYNCTLSANEQSPIQFAGRNVGVFGGAAPFRGVRILLGADVQLTQNFIIQGFNGFVSTAGLEVEGRANVGPVGFFDHGVAIVVGAGGVLQSGTVYGAGNTPLAIQINPGGFQGYNALPSIGITAATAQTRVGGVDKFYTDLPFFNTANGAALVNQS
jgi:hypothetical protein